MCLYGHVTSPMFACAFTGTTIARPSCACAGTIATQSSCVHVPVRAQNRPCHTTRVQRCATCSRTCIPLNLNLFATLNACRRPLSMLLTSECNACRHTTKTTKRANEHTTRDAHACQRPLACHTATATGRAQRTESAAYGPQTTHSGQHKCLSSHHTGPHCVLWSSKTRSPLTRSLCCHTSQLSVIPS